MAAARVGRAPTSLRDDTERTARTMLNGGWKEATPTY